MDRRRRTRLLGLTLAAALVASGCGRTSGRVAATSSSTTTTTATTQPPATTGPQLSGGYLSSSPRGAIFLQITMVAATTFQGSVILHLLFRDGPEDARNHFTGAVSEDDITFQLDPDNTEWKWGSSWSGSVTPDGFMVNLAATTGSLVTIGFEAATVDEYNTAVKKARPYYKAVGHPGQRPAHRPARQRGRHSGVKGATKRPTAEAAGERPTRRHPVTSGRFATVILLQTGLLLPG
jgi:hypothetical protein